MGDREDMSLDLRPGDSHAKVSPLFDTQMPGIAATSTDRAIDTWHQTAAIGESEKHKIDGVHLQ